MGNLNLDGIWELKFRPDWHRGLCNTQASGQIRNAAFDIFGNNLCSIPKLQEKLKPNLLKKMKLIG